MKDLFGYEKEEPIVEDTLVCIKCNERQPIDQFNALKYENTTKKTAITSTCITCLLNHSKFVKELNINLAGAISETILPGFDTTKACNSPVGPEFWA